MHIPQDIRAIVGERSEYDALLFYRQPELCYITSRFAVYKRKSYFGIVSQLQSAPLAPADRLRFILPCVADEITAVTDTGLFVVRIGGLLALFDADAADWPVSHCFTAYTVADTQNNTMELLKDSRKGLFDFKSKRLVIPIAYDEVTLWAGGEYLWVKQQGNFHFVKRLTGQFISLFNACMAFDTLRGMFALRHDGTLCCFTDEGYVDEAQYRRYIIERHGRGEFYNYRTHALYITDIYGRVLR